MPIDPSIPLRAYTPPKQTNTLGKMATAYGIKAARDREKRDAAEAERTAANRNALATLASQSANPDVAAFMGAGGDAAGAYQYADVQRKAAKAEREDEAAALEGMLANAEAYRKILPQVRDQGSLDQLRRLATNWGASTDDIPQVWDPATGPGWVQKEMGELQSESEQAAARLADLRETKAREGIQFAREKAGREREDAGPLVQVQTEGGVRYVPRSEAAGMTPPTRGGMVVEQTPEGGLSVRTGGATAQPTGKGADAYAKAEAKGFFEDYQTYSQAAKDARNKRYRIGRMRDLIKRVSTGRTAGARQYLKSIAKDFGVDLEAWGIEDDVAAAEAIGSLSTQFALDYVGQTKGAITEREMDLFAAAAPGLSRTPEGNAILLDMMEEVADREVEVFKMANAYRRKHGQLDPGFDAELIKWHESNAFKLPGERRGEQLEREGKTNAEIEAILESEGLII